MALPVAHTAIIAASQPNVGSVVKLKHAQAKGASMFQVETFMLNHRPPRTYMWILDVLLVFSFSRPHPSGVRGCKVNQRHESDSESGLDWVRAPKQKGGTAVGDFGWNLIWMGLRERRRTPWM
jgi:hypothetical protein